MRYLCKFLLTRSSGCAQLQLSQPEETHMPPLGPFAVASLQYHALLSSYITLTHQHITSHSELFVTQKSAFLPASIPINMSNFFEQNPFGRNQTHLVTQLQNDLAQKNELIAQLIQRVEALELSTPQSSSKKKKDTSAHITGSKNMTSSAVPALTSAKQQRATTNSPKTPVNKRANSTTPAPPTTSAKKNPLQMVSGEQPQGFERTKVSYFFFVNDSTLELC